MKLDKILKTNFYLTFVTFFFQGKKRNKYINLQLRNE